MTPKTFFSIIVKLFGLLFIKDVCVAFPSLFSQILLFANDTTSTGAIAFSLLPLVLYFFIGWYAIFRTAEVLKIFKLDNSFTEETLAFNLSAHSMISIAVIITAGYTLTTGIPELLTAIVYFFLTFRDNRLGFPNQINPSVMALIVPIVKVILGLILLGEKTLIITFLLKKTSVYGIEKES